MQQGREEIRGRLAALGMIERVRFVTTQLSLVRNHNQGKLVLLISSDIQNQLLDTQLLQLLHQPEHNQQFAMRPVGLLQGFSRLLFLWKSGRCW